MTVSERRKLHNLGIMSGKRGVAYWLGRAWLAAFGWRVEGGAPNVPKAVVVAALHTSSWDFPFTLATSAVLGLEMSWLGKHTLFRGPMGPVMRWLGGVAVDRTKKNDMVSSVVDILDQHEELFLVLAPEGTRGRASRWKTGFYHMAVNAKVPIVLGYLDYERKVSGLGEVFWPSGDLKADLPKIRAFYSNVRGKHPERQSEISFGEEVSLGKGLFGQSPRWGAA